VENLIQIGPKDDLLESLLAAGLFFSCFAPLFCSLATGRRSFSSKAFRIQHSVFSVQCSELCFEKVQVGADLAPKVSPLCALVRSQLASLRAAQCLRSAQLSTVWSCCRWAVCARDCRMQTVYYRLYRTQTAFCALCIEQTAANFAFCAQFAHKRLCALHIISKHSQS